MGLVNLSIWNIKVNLDMGRGNRRTVLKDEVFRRVIPDTVADRFVNAACDVDDDELVSCVGSRYIECSSEGLKKLLDKTHHTGWLKDFWIGIKADQTYSLEFDREGDGG